MYTRKINYIWVVNLLMIIFAVVLGIQQAGLGAEISHLENQYEKTIVAKRELTEILFYNQSESKLVDNQLRIEFVKPSKVIYFDTIDAVASK